MKINLKLPDLPDNFSVEFDNNNIICRYSLSFPKRLAVEIPKNTLKEFNIVKTYRGYRCVMYKKIQNANNIFTTYVELKKDTMILCREAKIYTIKNQISMF
jgi:hypothetical protein